MKPLTVSGEMGYLLPVIGGPKDCLVRRKDPVCIHRGDVTSRIERGRALSEAPCELHHACYPWDRWEVTSRQGKPLTKVGDNPIIVLPASER